MSSDERWIALSDEMDRLVSTYWDLLGPSDEEDFESADPIEVHPCGWVLVVQGSTFRPYSNDWVKVATPPHQTVAHSAGITALGVDQLR